MWLCVAWPQIYHSRDRGLYYVAATREDALPYTQLRWEACLVCIEQKQSFRIAGLDLGNVPSMAARGSSKICQLIKAHHFSMEQQLLSFTLCLQGVQGRLRP